METAVKQRKKGTRSMATDKAEILERVIDITCEQLSVADRDKVTAATSFVDDLQADSLDLAEMMMEFEEDFDIETEQDLEEQIKTVGDAVNFIVKQIEASND
jgi:acyl carrier protein